MPDTSFSQNINAAEGYSNIKEDKEAPYDGYDERDDTEEGARGKYLPKQIDRAGKA